jgi:hypothetical protein
VPASPPARMALQPHTPSWEALDRVELPCYAKPQLATLAGLVYRADGAAFVNLSSRIYAAGSTGCRRPRSREGCSR